MLIDWFTVVAQILNFAVLVWLLKRFLYGPLVAAIDTREKSMEDRLAAAARKEQEAAAQIEKSAKDAEEIEHEKAGVLAAARAEADRQRGDILAQARVNVKTLEEKWRDELEREKGAFFDEMRRRAANEILTVTRAALRDLACPDVQRCATQAFVARLQALDPAALRAFAASGLTVVSREELPEEQRGSVCHVLEERLGQKSAVTFEQAPAMAWGIELRGNGQRIGWTPDAYVDSLEERLRVELDRAASSIPVGVSAQEL
jgi:F-type H+-transporting ATPase subunit b